jgi:hypothetical protein
MLLAGCACPRIAALASPPSHRRPHALSAHPLAQAYTHVASSVRIDDLVARDACMLKADVEGYEPQVSA